MAKGQPTGETRPRRRPCRFWREKYFFTYIHLHSLGLTWIDLYWREGNSGFWASSRWGRPGGPPLPANRVERDSVEPWTFSEIGVRARGNLVLPILMSNPSHRFPFVSFHMELMIPRILGTASANEYEKAGKLTTKNAKDLKTKPASLFSTIYYRKGLREAVGHVERSEKHPKNRKKQQA
jgi:hypothetical protein